MSGDSDLHDVEANGSLLVVVGTPIHRLIKQLDFVVGNR
jgi:hypothetical protein